MRLNFDPQTVPVVTPERALPAITADKLELAAMQALFARGPRFEAEFTNDGFNLGKAIRPAAVLIGLVERVGGLHVILTRRAEALSTHAGQVSFPGGKQDEADASPQAAALREAHEEIGLVPSQVRVLGSLPEYVTGSGFAITPVIAAVGAGYVAQPNPAEVAAVFEVPLSFLMNPANHQEHRLESLNLPSGRKGYISMPYEAYGERYFIWGATASILRNFYAFLAQG